MVFAENQEKNDSQTFKYLLLQQHKSDFILSMTKEVEAHDSISHWAFRKKKKNDGNLKPILSNLVFQSQDIPICNINETQSQNLCRWGNEKWGVKYLENYCPVVDSISIRTKKEEK